jgi:hypothetical protein
MRRVSIATLMIVVLVCGVAIAALRDASDTWAGVMLLLTFGLLGFALLGIRRRTGARRAYWEGFALFGWSYLVLAFGPWFGDSVQPRLPTTALLDYAHGKLQPATAQTANLSWILTGSLNSTAGYVVAPPAPASGSTVAFVASKGTLTATAPTTLAFFLTPTNQEQFRRVGHCLFALLAALIGGMASRRMYASQDPGSHAAATD